MTLHLDKRQRAILGEMGVRVWWPEVATSSIVRHEIAESKKTPDPPLKVAIQNPKPPVTSRETSDRTSWPALRDTILSCKTCALGGSSPVLSSADGPCDWLVLGDMPDVDEVGAGLPFMGPAGRLLDQMLAAVGVTRSKAEPRAYLTLVVKCRPDVPRAPKAEELAACVDHLRQEIAWCQPKVILGMGRYAMQVLLSETPPEQAKLPLGRLRQKVWRFAGVPVVLTYPPRYLLQHGKDKAKAWTDLCMAKAVALGTITGRGLDQGA